MISQIHQVPGRIRIVVPTLKTHPEKVRKISNRLANLRGVTDVSVNRTTGSVVIKFCEETVVAGQVIDEVANCLGIDGLVGFPKSSRRWKAPSRDSQDSSNPRLDVVFKFAVRILVPVLVERYLGRTAGSAVSTLL